MIPDMDITPLLKILAALLLATAIALAIAIGGCTVQLARQEPDARPVTVCSGCGTQWWSQSGMAPGPITQCPNCPMSMEECERLIQAARPRRDGGRR